MQDKIGTIPSDTKGSVNNDSRSVNGGVNDAGGIDRGTCFCRRCGRKLKTAKAKEKGMGEVCFRKFQKEQHMLPLIQIAEKS